MISATASTFPALPAERRLFLQSFRQRQIRRYSSAPKESSQPFALGSQVKDFLHHRCSFRVNNQLLLIFGKPVVAKRDTSTAPFSVAHSGIKDRFESVAGVLRIIFVHDIQEGREIIVRRPVAVNIVVDSNEAYRFLRKEDFCVKSHLKIVLSKSAHILNDNFADIAGFYFSKHTLESGAIEFCTGKTVICKVPNIMEAVSYGIVLQKHLLIGNTVGFALEFVVF